MLGQSFLKKLAFLQIGAYFSQKLGKQVSPMKTTRSLIYMGGMTLIT